MNKETYFIPSEVWDVFKPLIAKALMQQHQAFLRLMQKTIFGVGAFFLLMFFLFAKGQEDAILLGFILGSLFVFAIVIVFLLRSLRETQIQNFLSTPICAYDAEFWYLSKVTMRVRGKNLKLFAASSVWEHENWRLYLAETYLFHAQYGSFPMAILVLPPEQTAYRRILADEFGFGAMEVKKA